MHELEEIKLRKIFYSTILDYLSAKLPKEYFTYERYKPIASELTDHLIEDLIDDKLHSRNQESPE